jgi:hypothetical protein
MSDPAAPVSPTTTASAPAAAPQVEPNAKPGWSQRLTRWAGAAVGVVVLISGGVKLLENFTLPPCDSSRSLDTIKSIFKDKKLPDPTLSDAKTVTSERSEKTCQTSYEIPNEKGTLDYRVFWDGWSAKVMITKVSN